MPIPGSDKEKTVRDNLTLLGESLLDTLLVRFSSGRHEKRNRAILLLLTAFSLSLLLIPSQNFLSVSYKAGEIATSDIRATQDYLLEDLPLTEKKRVEAEAAAPLVYSYRSNAPLELAQRLETAIVQLAELRAEQQTPDRDQLNGVVNKTLRIEVSREELAALGRVHSASALLGEVNRLFVKVYSQKIVADERHFATDRSHGILVLDSESKREIAAGDSNTYISLADARALLAKGRLGSGGEARDLQLIKGVMVRMLAPNMLYDREGTEEKKREARNAVRPVLYQVKQGEMIVRVGERISEAQALKLGRIFEARRGINVIVMGIGIFGIIMVLFYFSYRFARKNIRKFNPSNKDLFLLALVTSGNFLILKFAQLVSMALGGPFPYIDSAAYLYIFPFAAGSILIRIILNSEIALVYTAISAPLLGIMFNNSLPVVIYALLSGVVGAHGVRQCKDRGIIYIAGLKVSVVNLTMAISFQLFSDSLFTMQTIYCVIFALFGGLVNAALVTGTIPLIETLFHYTTDIKLLEMANLNSPVLRELMIRAPGTYHHSVVVGNLVEAAAEKIHANPLLARVAAYYHDIGKISKPHYFIENLSQEENRHDRLSPSMSALVLISHVKEGAELARENRLGLPIINIIKESHGTGLITFFYEKAKKIALAEGKTIDERDFRYPGPKPQTREAGLVLLADCVEAASRTLADPTPARIQGMVQKIINHIFIDGQLDECELTLKNLHEIAKSFNQILAGIYHQRIDYPEPAYKEKMTEGKKSGESAAGEPPETPADSTEKPKKNGGDDLKRLGIIR